MINVDQGVNVSKEEINKAIRKLGLGGAMNDLIGKDEPGWYKDFLLGIKCGIAAQKIVR